MCDATNTIILGDQPLFTPRRIRMICIGAGFSGLMLAHDIKSNPIYSFIDFKILEKSTGIGGTWYENRYPGAACDIPSHIYSFPFAPNPNWSKFYSSSAEIHDYIEQTAAKFGLHQYVSLRCRVVSTHWSDEAGYWNVTYEKHHADTDHVEIISEEAEILINASGFLNRKKFPNITGIETFKGKLVHTAAWDQSIDCKGKRVGVIGNGSSAIQVIPQLQPQASRLFEYIRSPTYIIPNFLAEFTPDGTNFEYSPEQQEEFRKHPEKLHKLRQNMEHAINSIFPIFQKDSPQQAYLREAATQDMKTILKDDQELLSSLVPDWPLGCRRVTPGHGYMEALRQENVTVRFAAIKQITEKGVVLNKDGQEFEDELDILVCATGFDTTFSPAWDIVGRHGSRLDDLWSKDPDSYFGIFAPLMPNYFIFLGPNSPVGHGSVMAVLPPLSKLILKLTTKLASQNYKSLCVKSDVVRDYNVYSQQWLKGTVWSGPCHSWYKRSDGRVTAMYAGSVFHYREMLANIRLEDFDYENLTHRDGKKLHNRFQFMGNGITKLKADQGLLGEYLDV